MTPVTAVETYREDPEVAEVQVQARTIADEARDLVIMDDASNNRALEMLAAARKYTRRLDELRKRWIKPLDDQIKLIRSDFEQMAAPAREADQILSRKTSEHRAKVAEAARKEQERLRLLAEKRQEKAAARAAERGLEPPPVMPIVPTVAPPAKSVVMAEAKVTYRKQVHFEITDPAAVPREWCCPDEKKIGAAARAGIIGPDNPIPGVRVWATEEATVRG